MKRIFWKVMWAARATSTLVGLTIMLAVVMGVATTALAGTGVGATFNLGKLNSVNALSTLSGSVNNALLRISNSNTGTSATALSLNTVSTSPPMKVTSSTKVANLNSDNLDGKDSSAFLAVNGKATDSDKLDGKDSTAFLGSNQKAADANMLDGFDSTSFVRGNGSADQAAVDLLQGSGWSNIFLQTQDPDIRLQYYCPSDLTTNGAIEVINFSGSAVNLFSDNGSTNPTYNSINNGFGYNEPAAPNGEHLTFQVQTPGPKVLTIELFSVHRPGGLISAGDCHVEAQVIVTR
jgi:hypothetical protein